MRIYVGNLSYSTTTEDLREEFEKYGAVDDAIVMSDRETGVRAGSGSSRWATRTRPPRPLPR